MKKIIGILICAFMIITLGTVLNIKHEKYKENKAIQALKSKKIELKTVKYNNGFEDLMPLKNILKDKKIVAMGEATHGTKEFFQMKHRMFQFLVEEMNYNIFAIEASMPDCARINDYILYGKGDAKDAVEAMGFWTWNTKEVLDMVEWMREYNKSHDNKIKFYGFDMQSSSLAATNVIDYLKNIDPDYEIKVHSKLEEFNDKKLDYVVDKELPINDIKEIINNCDKKKDEYIKRSSKEKYEVNNQNLKIMCEFYDVFGEKSSDFEKENKRDKYMAENIKWILNHEKEDSKIMIWAHNTHVSKQIDNFSNLDKEYETENIKRIGSNLYNMYKDKIYIIGFEFNKGDFNAVVCNKETGNRTVKKCTLPSSKKGSGAYIFSRTSPMFFIDFQSCSKDKYLLNILLASQMYHDIGANFVNEKASLKSQVLSERYDGLIFIDTTSNAETN
ncbi:erythromycin esterase family protein [Clostridium senegalense]|uniref:erythromycin esterase family protein n=1 Tax=Clostridium senegalense TaxID=1465809 RepID=UPI001C1148D3|nr:erythromycin esterase family protein [Clostridium senegalense]MBU5226299.1 erythromycin esterase family protein [Clostridium senegalense]